MCLNGWTDDTHVKVPPGLPLTLTLTLPVTVTATLTLLLLVIKLCLHVSQAAIGAHKMFL